MTYTLLDRLAMQMVKDELHGCCGVVRPCERHQGFIDAADRLVFLIEAELAKVGIAP